MQITKTSMLSGNSHTMEIAATDSQFKNWFDGMLIQDAFPQLTAGEREFVKTGITPSEWNRYMEDC